MCAINFATVDMIGWINPINFPNTQVNLIDKRSEITVGCIENASIRQHPNPIAEVILFLNRSTHCFKDELNQLYRLPMLPFRRLVLNGSLHWRPSWLSCINEYLAIDSGGYVSDLVVARNCWMTRMLTREAELVSEWTGLPGRAKSVKRVGRSNGLDTALFKNYLYLFVFATHRI